MGLETYSGLVTPGPRRQHKAPPPVSRLGVSLPRGDVALMRLPVVGLTRLTPVTLSLVNTLHWFHWDFCSNLRLLSQ